MSRKSIGFRFDQSEFVQKQVVLNQLQNWLGWSSYELGQLGEDWHVFFRIHTNNNFIIIISNDNKIQSYDS